MLLFRVAFLLFQNVLFANIAPQTTENRTIVKSLLPFLKYSAKYLFINRLYQTVEDIITYTSDDSGVMIFRISSNSTNLFTIA